MPVPDASGAWADAAARCRAVQTYSAVLRLSGRAGATGKIKATVLAGLTTAGQIRFDVPAPFGRPVFTLAGTDGRATLLSRDRHVLTAPAGEILEALVGLSLGPRALVAVLAGCGQPEEPVGQAIRYQNVTALGAAGRRVFLQSVGGRWRIVAAELPGLVVDYGDERQFPDGPPTRIRMTSAAGRSPSIALSLTQSQIEMDVPLPAAAFALDVPADATPLTLEDLRAAGPLGEKR